MNHEQFVGIDIAKEKFDVALEQANSYRERTFPNTKSGINAFYQWLMKYAQQPWVCMEATGHYGEMLAEFLYEKGLKVSVINPLQIKRFGQAKLMRNKNDLIDAKLIAQFGKVMNPRLFIPKCPKQKELNDLVKLLNTLKMQLVQFKNQRDSIQSVDAVKAIKRFIIRLEKDIASIQDKLAALTEQDELFKKQLELITSIKGVGNLTAYTVLARIGDINQFETAKQFAAFIGVSPRETSSGKFIGKTRLSCLGDSSLRKALF
ncbi:MAG: IS110 family transposase, partial [Gammaproteobacteria bacterium]